MQKIILLILAIAGVAMAIERIDKFPKCSDANLVAPSYGFEQWTAKCWADNTGKSDLTSGKPDAAMCACYNAFSDANMALCSTAAQYEYKAYLKNGCAKATESTWKIPGTSPDATFVGVGASPPCIQSCALAQSNIDDVCTIAEKCTDVSTCLWNEALYLHTLKASCKPACTLEVMGDCITANKLQSASYCETLEVCQPVYYNSPYAFTLASVAPGANQKCPGTAGDLAAMDTILNYRRATCKCPHGFQKSANKLRCDPKFRKAVTITVSQQLRSNDGNLLFWQTNTALQNKIRVFIGQRIFATDKAKAAGIFENDATNLLELVKITKIESVAAVKTSIAQSRRALTERELVQGAAPARNAGEGTGPGVKITYTVSVENNGKWATLGLTKETTAEQNIQQYVNDVVSYAPLKNTVGWTHSASLLGQITTAASKHINNQVADVYTQTQACDGATLVVKCLTTNGSGTGAVLSVTTDSVGLITGLTITSPGSNFAVGDKLTLSSNGASTVITLTTVGTNGALIDSHDAAYWNSPKDATSSFAEGLTSMIKSSGNCDVNFNQPCTKTWAAFTDHPSSGVVVVERFSPPTAAPTFAPTARAEYVSSPIVMFSVAGAVAVLLFGFFWIRAKAQTPAKTEIPIERKKFTRPAAASARGTSAPAVLPPPAPNKAEVVEKQPVKAQRA